MSTPTGREHRWGALEKSASLTVILMALGFIGSRLAFAVWWPLPTFDFIFSAVAVLLLVVTLGFRRDHRSWRMVSIIVAAASQLGPMVWREPMLLVPLLGAFVPIAVIVWALVALSHKDRPSVHPPHA